MVQHVFIYLIWLVDNYAVTILSAVTIWILNTWIPDSMDVQYSNGKVTRLFSPVFRPPFECQTIWQPDTNLPFEYRTSLVFRCLLYIKKCPFSSTFSFFVHCIKYFTLFNKFFIICIFFVFCFFLWFKTKNLLYSKTKNSTKTKVSDMNTLVDS